MFGSVVMTEHQLRQQLLGISKQSYAPFNVDDFIEALQQFLKDEIYNCYQLEKSKVDELIQNANIKCANKANVDPRQFKACEKVFRKYFLSVVQFVKMDQTHLPQVKTDVDTCLSQDIETPEAVKDIKSQLHNVYKHSGKTQSFVRSIFSVLTSSTETLKSLSAFSSVIKFIFSSLDVVIIPILISLEMYQNRNRYEPSTKQQFKEALKRTLTAEQAVTYTQSLLIATGYLSLGILSSVVVTSAAPALIVAASALGLASALFSIARLPFQLKNAQKQLVGLQTKIDSQKTSIQNSAVTLKQEQAALQNGKETGCDILTLKNLADNVELAKTQYLKNVNHYHHLKSQKKGYENALKNKPITALNHTVVLTISTVALAGVVFWAFPPVGVGLGLGLGVMALSSGLGLSWTIAFPRIQKYFNEKVLRFDADNHPELVSADEPAIEMTEVYQPAFEDDTTFAPQQSLSEELNEQLNFKVNKYLKSQNAMGLLNLARGLANSDAKILLGELMSQPPVRALVETSLVNIKPHPEHEQALTKLLEYQPELKTHYAQVPVERQVVPPSQMDAFLQARPTLTPVS
jgi:hypothetical protein